MPHLFKQDALFGPETIATMSEAFEAACKQLDDTGQPELVLKSLPSELLQRQAPVSAIRFACGKLRLLGCRRT